MEIVYKRINDIIPYKNNPRINQDAVPYVANSIKEFGFKVPIVIDKNNVIVNGHTRLIAAQSLNMEKVPCIVADDLSPEQIKAFRIADNKVAEFSQWDMDKLDIELSNLNLDMSEFGIDIDVDVETEDIAEIEE